MPAGAGGDPKTCSLPPTRMGSTETMDRRPGSIGGRPHVRAAGRRRTRRNRVRQGHWYLTPARQLAMSPMDTEVAGATETCASKIASGHIGGRRGGRAGRAPKDGEVYRRGAATYIFVDLGWSSPIRKIRCDRAHRSSRIDVQRRYVARAQGRTSRKSQQAVTEVGGCAER